VRNSRRLLGQSFQDYQWGGSWPCLEKSKKNATTKTAQARTTQPNIRQTVRIFATSGNTVPYEATTNIRFAKAAAHQGSLWVPTRRPGAI
jgi:hypothetical protein